jgi:hypothetical protein
VVVILMGPAEVGTAIVASGLSVALGWRLLDARDPHAIQAAVARTLGRREHLVITSGPLTADEQQFIRGEWHGVRFVELSDFPGNEHDIVRAIREEYGV